VDLTLNDPLEIGLSLNAQAFSIGADYVAIMAARRESDVLLTEGHDASFAFPAPTTPSTARSRATPRPSATAAGRTRRSSWPRSTWTTSSPTSTSHGETAIGWKGVTFNPVYSNGALDIAGEYSFITYNQNWQAWGNDSKSITDTLYPGAELDSGVLHNFRSAFQPFQEKQTQILALKARYVVDLGRGIDVFGKFKYIHDIDKRLNDKKYLPYQDGDCPAAAWPAPATSATTTMTAMAPSTPRGLLQQPGLVPDGSGYQFKPFDDISDDDAS